MSDPDLLFQLRARIAQNLALKEDKKIMQAAGDGSESDTQREARLMNDDSAWNAFGGSDRSILPKTN